MTRALFALGIFAMLGLGPSGLTACGRGPCEDLELQLQACPHYQPVVVPIDCSGSVVNDQAQCILDSGQDICSADGLAIANAACRK